MYKSGLSFFRYFEDALHCLITYIVLNKRSNYFPSSFTYKVPPPPRLWLPSRFPLVFSSLISVGVILRILESVVLCPSLLVEKFSPIISSCMFSALFFLGFQLLICESLMFYPTVLTYHVFYFTFFSVVFQFRSFILVYL